MVYLVGAGPGDNGLITLKGLECIKNAEVIIFDHLVNPSLLNNAPQDCRLIYAGKISGNHHLTQDETNFLLVKYAMQGRSVVRLKGGDPFIFGRGGEEAQILADNGIPFEIVPGVSSCYSAAAYAGIPVTHRDAASSFHVITGHEKNEHIDYHTLANEEGTLVFMMGLKSLPKICDKLMASGKSPETPAAVISNGTLNNQQYAVGTLATIADTAKKEKMAMPAVIVIGEVIEKRNPWFRKSGKLCGVKIISTATTAVSQAIQHEAEKYGGELTQISIIKTIPINDDKFKSLKLPQYTHILFSSVNGVDIFFEYIRRMKIDIRSLCNKKFAVVGKRTAQRLEEYGIYADYIPEKYNSAALSRLLEGELKSGDNVLLLRAEAASDEVTSMLEKRGIAYTDLAIYKTAVSFEKAEPLKLYLKDADYVIFSSGSAVKSFNEMVDDRELFRDTKFISIGSSTTKTAEEVGIKIYRTAENSDAEGIVQCILEDIE